MEQHNAICKQDELQVVSFTAPKSHISALESLAKRNTRTKSQELRRALEAHLEAEEKAA